jgi:hypothetical protein
MKKGRTYIIIVCPECRKRVRRYSDGRLSFHYGTLIDPAGCPAYRNATPPTGEEQKS